VTDKLAPSFLLVSSYPHAYGRPDATAVIRSQPEDFQVEEQLGFQPEGEGEHHFLYLQKRNTNTEWLAKQLARFCGVPPRDVSYAGLKDRNAVTSQWFSIRIPGTETPDWSELESDDLKLLQATRHRRKLRRGALAQNHFRLRLRQLKTDKIELEGRLKQIAAKGVPNYYGEQRFGHDQNNLTFATKLFAGELKKLSRHKKGIYLSAARSYLFNMVLAKRVAEGTWDQAILGDSMLLDGSRSHFSILEIDSEIQQRISEMDIHPTGPLWGKGEQPVSLDTDKLENGVLGEYLEWTQGLIRFGLGHERRALRSRVIDLEFNWLTGGDLELRFGLYPGSYATSVLREVVS
jgi:tRNA pseudouridine13 synthase